MFKRHRLAGALLALVLLVGVSPIGGNAGTGDSSRYLVVFQGDYAVDGTYAVGSSYAVLCTYAVTGTYAVGGGYAVGCNYAVDGDYAVSQAYAVGQEYAVSLVRAAGGTVVSDMLGQIGVFVVESSNSLFADVMGSYAVVDEVGQDLAWQGIPAGAPPGGGGGSVAHADPFEALQWDMDMINTPEAHAVQAGWGAVDVGILDSGIDGTHVDFKTSGVSNVACDRGKDFVPEGPGVGLPGGPCVDNQVHGTHVAGIVAARANSVGVVGVAPNVTLVPVKVCDTPGYCYASAVVSGITYAGDAKLDVINMSFFVDDDALLESTELKCMNDPRQRAFRRSTERALQYARNQGVVPVAAIGNSDTDLGAEKNCEVVPAESSGVIATVALGPDSEKADYSSYGQGAADLAAPGGNAPVTGASCDDQVLSTVPGGYGCLQGTSMASPHTTGVAALIVSQLGTLGADGDVKLSPTRVEAQLQRSAVDIGVTGYDECFGHGRIDALRAVKGTSSNAYDATAPFCPEYDE